MLFLKRMTASPTSSTMVPAAQNARCQRQRLAVSFCAPTLSHSRIRKQFPKSASDKHAAPIHECQDNISISSCNGLAYHNFASPTIGTPRFVVGNMARSTFAACRKTFSISGVAIITSYLFGASSPLMNWEKSKRSFTYLSLKATCYYSSGPLPKPSPPSPIKKKGGAVLPIKIDAVKSSIQRRATHLLDQLVPANSIGTGCGRFRCLILVRSQDQYLLLLACRMWQ